MSEECKRARSTTRTGSFHDIVEAIYNAAAAPEGWEGALCLIAQHFSSTASGIFVQNIRSANVRQVALLGFEEEFIASYVEHFAKVNPWFLEPGRLAHWDRY